MGYLNNFYKIFRGTTAGDDTGTPARTAAQGLNENWDKVDNALEAINNAAEKTTNRATNLDAPSHTQYPTTQAVKDAIEATDGLANAYTDAQLTAYQPKSEKGQANGYAGLDANAKVPAINTYGAMDEIIEGEYIDATTFNDDLGNPVTPGEAKLYQDISTGNPTSGKQYRWSGTQFSEIPASPGTTDMVPEGASNKYFTEQRVRDTVLFDLNPTINAVIVAADSIIGAFGKLQAQINAVITTLGTKLDKGGYNGTAQTLYDFANTKETPAGAQSKADAAEQAAKDYYDGLSGVSDVQDSNGNSLVVEGVAVIPASTPYDDTAVQNTLSNHETRITALEGAATPQEPISVVWNTGDPLTFSLPKAPSAVDINGSLLSKWLEDGVTADEWSLSGTTVTLNGITPNDGSNIQFHFGTSIDAIDKLTSSTTFIAGGYISTNGFYTSTGSNWWSTSEFIDTRPGLRFYLSGKFTSGTYSIVSFYTITKDWISSIQSNSTETIYNNEEIVIPANAFYYRITNLTSQKNTVSVNYPADPKISKLLSESISNKYNDITDSIAFKTGYLTTTGEVTLHSNFRYSNYINVKDTGKYYLYMTVILGSYAVICYYNERKELIDFIPAPATQTIYKFNELLIPSGCAYVRISLFIDHVPGFKITTDIQTLGSEVYNQRYFSKLWVPQFTDAVIGKQCLIYLDGICSETNPDEHLIIEGASGVERRGNALKYAPSTWFANKTVSFSLTDGTLVNKRETVSTTIRTINPAGGGGATKNIMMLGDSLTNNGVLPKEVYNLLSIDGDYVINQIGTRTSSGVLHEGRSSWAWKNYVESEDFSGSNNPFLYSGVLNIQQYVVDNGFAGIDICMINLGTNDVSQGTKLQVNISEVIGYAKTFVDAIVSDYPNCKICIGLPSLGAPEAVLTTANAEAFRSNIGRLNIAYVETFDNGKYSPNVTTFNCGAAIDRINAYPYVNEQVSSRIAETRKVYTDLVHPSNAGYLQWADAYYAKIRSILSGNL